MATYDPLPTVSIGGVDYTSETINGITTTAGRNTVDEQPRAGYATISLRVLDGSFPNIQLNAGVHVSVNDSSAVSTMIFSGYVTDVARQITNHGVIGTEVSVDVTVAGPISRLARILTATTYPKEFDGDRVAEILFDYEATSWTEEDPTLTWAGVNASVTWENYDPAFVGTIDTPGSYELTAYSGGAVSAISHLNQVANSALGVLWEGRDGLVNYSDAASRLTDVGNNGFLEIDSDYIAGIGLASRSSLGDLINDMRVTYKNGQTATASDLVSIATYGQFVGQKDTLLENLADAQDVADLYITTRAYPRNSLQALTVPLHNPNLPDALRDSLIESNIGLPITVANLPGSIYPNAFFGFVEGVSYTVARKAAAVTLYVSEYALSQIEMAWQQVNALEKWNTLFSTLTWENAEVVG